MVFEVNIRFYEELNDYLSVDRSKRTFVLPFDEPRTVKEIIQSAGVPPDEVDLVLVDGESVSFDHVIRGGERVSVYPIFETFDITGVTKLRDKPLNAIRSQRIRGNQKG